MAVKELRDILDKGFSEEEIKMFGDGTEFYKNYLYCIEKYEGKDVVVEQDEKNNFHCGQCRLSYKAAQGLKGKMVTLYNVTVNDAKSKDNYPLFAKFCIKENKQTSVQI